MAGLGDRLREIRTRAGISQIKLAQQIGFGRAHGYKYIYRLEKGLVPNPTLRTIAAYLEACRAGWTDVTDVLPLAGSGAHPDAAPAVAEPEPAPPETPPPAPPRRQDGRPAREHLREQRIASRAEHARAFWERVARAEQTVHRLLAAARVPPSRHREYLAHARSVCAVLDATAGARPGAADAEIARLGKSAVESGLDPALITGIDTACFEALRPGTTR